MRRKYAVQFGWQIFRPRVLLNHVNGDHFIKHRTGQPASAFDDRTKQLSVACVAITMSPARPPLRRCETPFARCRTRAHLLAVHCSVSHRIIGKFPDGPWPDDSVGVFIWSCVCVSSVWPEPDGDHVVTMCVRADAVVRLP